MRAATPSAGGAGSVAHEQPNTAMAVTRGGLRKASSWATIPPSE